MSSKNVIITLVAVIALIVFVIIKIRLEPKKKFTLTRNPSRIEYLETALCKMDCQSISIYDVTEVLKKGEINLEKSDIRKRPCAIFTVYGETKKGIGLTVVVDQCGTVVKVTNCYLDNGVMPCDCENSRPISFTKLKIDAQPA